MKSKNKLISVESAGGLILARSLRTARQRASLTDCLGRILAQDVSADRDYPPYDRAAMDGIAVRRADLAGNSALHIAGIQAAGQNRQKLPAGPKALEVMTGAILPAGSDTVIPYEELELQDQRAVVHQKWIDLYSGQPYVNVHRQASDCRKGDRLIRQGQRIGAVQLSTLATVGLVRPWIVQPPEFAFLSTGDELVDPAEKPRQHQVRISNVYALRALLKEWSGLPATIHHAADALQPSIDQIQSILAACSWLIICGAVSKGKYDFIPAALKALGFKTHFHGIQQRPGKPMLFASRGKKLVFALPGNPVSAMVCFRRYVLPALASHLPDSTPLSRPGAVQLTQPIRFPKQMQYFPLVTVQPDAKNRLTAAPVAASGSGDLIALGQSHGFLELPAHRDQFRAGSRQAYWPWVPDQGSRQ
ncbi:MAG: molybdopterin molybdotransferase MoeA [Leptospiraceae bacterium]|nr:molybdopterin molybdotransferase MoeA [Leptospiraceae bacterium]